MHMYVHACLHLCVCTCVHVHEEQVGLLSEITLTHFTPLTEANLLVKPRVGLCG